MPKFKRTGTLSAVETIDFSALKAIVIAKAEIPHASPEYLDLLEKWYKRFLYLVAKYPNKKITINNLVDEFWHQHMLDSRNYINDCFRLYGGYLHHDPYFGLGSEQKKKALEKAYAETDCLMQREFGESYTESFIEQVQQFGVNRQEVRASYCSAGGAERIMAIPNRQQANKVC